jgi:hypothetical protein
MLAAALDVEVNTYLAELAESRDEHGRRRSTGLDYCSGIGCNEGVCEAHDFAACASAFTTVRGSVTR